MKKPGLEAQFKNLRPISNLQFISKLAERSAYEQTYDHLITHNLIPELQSAYRKRYSTETALLKVQNDILLNMDRQHVTLLVLLEILLRRLETTFGITGTALQWFSSYLGNRSQRVVFGDGVSESFYLACGVPQGFCLGPLFFTLYASKLFEVIKHHLPSAHAYADDTQLCVSFKPDCSASEAECFSAMEKCIRAVRAWIMQDKMKLNDDKTEFLIIGTSQQLKKVRTDISVGDAVISPVLSARNLGPYFDSNMTLVPFINNTCKSTFSQLYNIRRIRKYLTMDTSKTLVHAMITSRIDYCNSLLCGLPDNSLNKLQRVQNAAARLITGTAKFSHITPVLRSLHWLPIKQRVQFKILILIFKAINGLAPNYISNLVNILCPSKYLLRRNNEILLEPYNNKTKKTLGDRAFAVACFNTRDMF